MFNSENSIFSCVSSVLNQTFDGEIEIIIVNDGSTDNSKVIVEKLIRENSQKNITLFNKENGGVSSARNKGLEIAEGDFIALLDSDDEWFPNKIEKQLNIFNSDNSIGFVGGLIFKPANLEKGYVDIPLAKLIFKNYFQPSTVMFKKEVLDKVGYFDETQKYAEEGNYFIRIAKFFKCVLLNEQLVLYGQGKFGFGESGLSANLREMEIGELKNLKFAYKNNYISFFTFVIAISYSTLKYMRRIVLVKFRRKC
tara:strand:- start:4265 stop:5023 length:759 start_codon:yes stop_codon:yes gene_type:complete